MATWSRPARAGPGTPLAPRSSTAGCMAAASRSRSRISPPTPSRCWRCRPRPRPGAKLNGTIELHLTYDEEVGGEIGPRWLIEQGISNPNIALGAGFSYAVVTAHNGCLHLEVQVDGRSAHAAMPWTGVDALEAATHILTWPLCLAEDAGRAPLGHRGHRQPAADDRPDQGRHQHQRGARTASPSGSTGAWCRRSSPRPSRPSSPR